jgi:mRNA-degrading endonuclease RelE of RelBE toxin-antitoxin system
MRVTKTTSVDAAIRTLSEDDRQLVFSWLDHLKNWENDEQVRNMSEAMVYNNTFVLNTSDDIRIFFTLDVEKKAITIVDIAKPSRFETAGMRAE